jgi:chemotaxis response regulator CheB
VSGLVRLGQCRLTELKDAARSDISCVNAPGADDARSLLLATGTPSLRVPSDHSAQLHRINRLLDEVAEPLRKEFAAAPSVRRDGDYRDIELVCIGCSLHGADQLDAVIRRCPFSVPAPDAVRRRGYSAETGRSSREAAVLPGSPL